MKRKIFFLLQFIFLIACSEDYSELSPEEIADINKTGQKAATELMESLKNALMTSVQDSGLVAAISVCKTTAPQLAQDIANSSERIIQVGRTSRKTRNKNNNPDPIDLEAIRYFEKNMSSEPAFFAARDGQNYRYYQPIFIQPLCLNCHGTPETVDEQVRQEIRTYYPADQAVDYAIGDLRGLFRIKIAGRDVKN